MEIPARRQARLLEQRRDALAGGARIGGGLEHDQLIGAKHLRERARGVHQRPEVGLAVARQRGGHADQDRVHLGQPRIARRRLDPPRSSVKSSEGTSSM